jgi:hypothetical protein
MFKMLSPFPLKSYFLRFGQASAVRQLMLNHSRIAPNQKRKGRRAFAEPIGKDAPAASDDRHFVASGFGTSRRVPMIESR